MTPMLYLVCPSIFLELWVTLSQEQNIWTVDFRREVGLHECTKLHDCFPWKTVAPFETGYPALNIGTGCEMRTSANFCICGTELPLSLGIPICALSEQLGVYFFSGNLRIWFPTHTSNQCVKRPFFPLLFTVANAIYLSQPRGLLVRSAC